MDIHTSTINGGETANEKGFLEPNVHVSLECDPDFPMNPRSTVSQGARFGVYWVITGVSDFITDEVLAYVVCHLSCIAHGAGSKLCSVFPPFGIPSPALVNYIHFQAIDLGMPFCTDIWSENGDRHKCQNKAPNNGIDGLTSHGSKSRYLFFNCFQDNLIELLSEKRDSSD